MEELRINLPILLWVISWNVEDLISDPSVKFAQTTLMVSKELPTILSRWFTGGWKKISWVLTGFQGKITAVGRDYRAFQWLGFVLQCLIDGKVESVKVCRGSTHTSNKGRDVGPVIPQVYGEHLCRREA